MIKIVIKESKKKSLNEAANFDTENLALFQMEGSVADSVILCLADYRKIMELARMGDEDMKPAIVATLEMSLSDHYQTYVVNSSAALSGRGPLIYELAMGFASLSNHGLMPDRHTLSPAAQNIWKKFDQRFSDAESSFKIDIERGIGGTWNGETLRTPEQVKMALQFIIQNFERNDVANWLYRNEEARQLLNAVVYVDKISWGSGEKFPPDEFPFIGIWDEEKVTPQVMDDGMSYPNANPVFNKGYKYAGRKEQVKKLISLGEIVAKKYAKEARNPTEDLKTLLSVNAHEFFLRRHREAKGRDEDVLRRAFRTSRPDDFGTSFSREMQNQHYPGMFVDDE